jgi:methionyl-tRNA formyltransferase
MTSLDLIFAASGDFALPTLIALREAGHRILQVFTQPDRPAGRGRKLAPTPVGQYALEHNLPLIRTPDINLELLPPADVMIVIAFGQKICETSANHSRLGSINLHASRLPKYRGAGPINRAILNGETETGNSIIRLANRMDAGAMLGISLLKIDELETAGELHDRLARDGAPLVLQVLEQLAAGTAVETPQDESQATKGGKLNRESSRIDWNTPAETIARHIRGMYPWPGCRVRLLSEKGEELDRLTLVRARLASGAGGPAMNQGDSASSGTIASDGTIMTASGPLEILEVQPEGKRPMALQSYRNGHSWDAGQRLESIV